MDNWIEVELGDILEQYRVEHIVQDNQEYGQITISKNGYVKFRGNQVGKTIGRKRQFIVDLTRYPNTVIFTRQGVADGAIGFAPDEVNGCIATENMPMFSLRDSVSKRFLELFFFSQQFKDEVSKMTPTGSAQKSIHERDLLKIKIKLPSIDIQNKICSHNDVLLDQLKRIDAEIIKQEEFVSKLRQSILQEAIAGKLTAQWRLENPDTEPALKLLEKIRANKHNKKEKLLPTIDDNEILFDIPITWEWCKFGELCHYEQGIQVDLNLQFKQYQEGLVRFLRILDFTQETDDLRYIKDPGEKYHIDENELVMVRYGASAGFVGTNKSGVLANNLFKIKYGDLNIKYLRYFFETEYFNYELGMNTRGVAMPAISFKFLDLLVFPLPPTEEQNVIVEKINSLFAICDELKQQISRSKTNVEMLIHTVLKEAFER